MALSENQNKTGLGGQPDIASEDGTVSKFLQRTRPNFDKEQA